MRYGGHTWSLAQATHTSELRASSGMPTERTICTTRNISRLLKGGTRCADKDPGQSRAVSPPAERIQSLLRHQLPTRHHDCNPTEHSKSLEHGVRETFELFILRSRDKGTLTPGGNDEMAMRDRFMKPMAHGFLKFNRYHRDTLEIFPRAVRMKFWIP